MLAYLLSLLISTAYAEFHIVDLNEVYLDYRNYSMVNPNARNLLIYPDTPKEAINVGIKLDLLKYMYIDNEIQSITTDAQYKGIGLDLRIGVRATSWLEVGLWHRSQHVLDGTQSFMGGNFPSEDAFNVKVYLFRKYKRDSVLE